MVLEIGDELFFKEFEFSSQSFSQKRLDSNNDNIEDLVDFCDKSGILELFGNIKDLNTYLTGVEVGLDSNARKNRSGKFSNKS